MSEEIMLKFKKKKRKYNNTADHFAIINTHYYLWLSYNITLMYGLSAVAGAFSPLG